MEQPIDRAEVGRRIRVLRKSRDLPIQRLADLAGISPGYLSDVERGSSAPSAEKLARIAAELGVSTDYLLTGATTSSAPVQVPLGLAAAADQLNLTYTQTMRLLAGKRSLVARRSSREDDDWSKADWVDFYNKVRPYL
jgi:transcriptional regulator with XRE-family HTH domain